MVLSPSDRDFVTTLRQAVDEAASRMLAIADNQAAARPSPDKWSRKEILGHLIDSAVNNQARFVRAQQQADLVFVGYDQDAWVRLQRSPGTAVGGARSDLVCLQPPDRGDHAGRVHRRGRAGTAPAQPPRDRLSTAAARRHAHARVSDARLRGAPAASSPADSGQGSARRGQILTKIFRQYIQENRPEDEQDRRSFEDRLEGEDQARSCWDPRQR